MNRRDEKNSDGMNDVKISLRYSSMLRIILWMVSLSALLLSGCSTSKDKEKTITLIFWGDLYNRAFAQKVVDRYNSKNPAVKAKLLAIERDYESKILTMSAAGIPPDVILVPQGKHLDYASKGIFLPLDKYESDPEFKILKEDMWQNIWDGCRYNGKLYVVPAWTNSIGIFYNKTLFDKAGVPYPTQDWTFEELLDKAKRLTFDFDDDGRIDQFGFGGFPLSLWGWNLYMLIEAFGGHLYSNDGKDCLVNTPESINAIQWVVDLAREHRVCPSRERGQRIHGSVVSGSGEDYFRSGKIAMVFWGRWYITILRQSKNLQWAAAPFPKGENKVMFQIPVNLAISSKTKYPDECWRFLKFMMGEEGQEMLTQDRSDIPILKSMAYSQQFLDYAGRPDANKVFRDMLEYATTPKSLVGASEWYKFAQDKFELVALGRLSVEDACDEIAKKYESFGVR